MNQYDWLGWASSLILLATMGKQVATQWSAESTKGVSKWLYIGQFAAEFGFVAYSWLVKNWVFVFTNVALILLNVVGLVILVRKWRRKGEAAS